MKAEKLAEHAPEIRVNGFLATKKEKAGEGWLEDTWHVWFSDGKRITSSELNLDKFYSGWRDLPSVEPAGNPLARSSL